MIVALYHDPIAGLPHAGRQQVDTQVFAADFNFTAPELHAYFDDDPANPTTPRCGLSTRREPNTPGSPHCPRPSPRDSRSRDQPGLAVRPSPAPVLTGTEVAPPAVNTGWEAKEYVAESHSRELDRPRRLA